MRAPVHSFQSLPGHSQAPPLPGSPGVIHLWTYFLTMLVWPCVLRFSPGTNHPDSEQNPSITGHDPSDRLATKLGGAQDAPGLIVH